jgi:hypothetical protein
MESKINFVLRSKANGLYFSRMAGLTVHLWSAWRFTDKEYLYVFLKTHGYAPDIDEYEIVPVKLTIEEVKE